MRPIRPLVTRALRQRQFPRFCRIQHRAFTSRHDDAAARAAVISVLNNIASKREVQRYLDQFTSVSSQQFAVIKVGGAVLTDHLDQLCASLRNLNQMGLFPVVIHGAGPQLNKLLAEAGVEPQYKEGIRITDGKTLGIAKKLFLEENLKLVNRLEELGVPARPITDGVLKATYKDKETYKFVGEINHVNVASIHTAIAQGYIPILTCMAETAEGQTLNVNADKAAAELARTLVPLKTVYLSEKGGIYDKETNRLIEAINLDEEYEEYMKKPWVIHGTRSKIRDIKTLLDELPPTSSVAIIHPARLEKELFTDSGAGTLIRRGTKLRQATSLSEFQDLAKVKKVLVRERDGLDSTAVVDRYIESLKGQKFRAYFDNDMQALGIVLPSEKGPIAHLSTLTMTKSAWRANIADNIFQNLKRDFPKLAWTVKQDDDNLMWFAEKAEGSIARKGEVLFWYGIEGPEEIRQLMSEFVEHGRKMFGDINLESQLHRAAASAERIRAGAAALMRKRSFSTAQRRMYTTNPNPPFGVKNKEKNYPSRVALIGARGYTGQALIDLLAAHPYMDLCHVSSRELKGKHLSSYGKKKIMYESLTPDDVHGMASAKEVDCWVMALPNGVCHPYVDAIDESGHDEAVVVDLSADYRFNDKWTYGLPELTPRSKIASSKRISNPGCYATAAQLGIAPLLKFLSPTAHPTVFGVSGYSGAGTKPSPKNDVELLRDNLIPYSLTDHIHEREISHHLGTPVAFIPHVADWFSGIHHTISIPLSQKMTSRDIRQLYQDRYHGEDLVKVTGESPLVKDIKDRNGVEIGGFAVHSGGNRVVVNVTIDNLRKGAATQCLQNMNLALGHAEFDGINV
ncbi:bifunctional acetylglutamate kinase/N-acetyl-gamma-glutamyl-phosphate reductase [Piedraia hortae CBS 480.64]|uniref:acetylglutamate kinase n=1 Tax=Piedraia hortae CBS 480.64 TaxID=1314780 RepID=A0A6A7BVN9_9PEZI|nr:bifunctional acetylglutamate kinase/N-acetyl-gamma-glutamyl-phosphate reductase [Piedraia hortae CBS 480.64]